MPIIKARRSPVNRARPLQQSCISALRCYMHRFTPRSLQIKKHTFILRERFVLA
jgi:hypothetical protein